MTVVAYVSGHGLGHSSREVEILRRLPPDIPLVVKTAAPEWFWRQEVGRPFALVPESFDVGCLQTSSLEVDRDATLAAWREIDSYNRARARDEAEDLRRRGARVVVTDVASFPLTLAAALGIPGLCVANFTWADIYAEYADTQPGFCPVVAQLTDEYRQASLLLEAGLSLPMPYFPKRKSVGLVARVGKRRRDELLALLSPDAAAKRLALIYAGNWGLPVPWERLERFTNWHFLTLAPLPGMGKNASYIPQTAMPHPDFVASVDLVISKAGYGLVGECLSAGTPFLYCPREGFAEYGALERALSDWPGGLRLSADAFLAAEWEGALTQAPRFGSLPSQSAPGGGAAADAITAFWEGKDGAVSR